MDIRIKIVTKGGGSKEYYPQYKSLLSWKCFKKLAPCWADSIMTDAVFDTEKECKGFLDKMIESKLNKKVVKTEYVDYP